MLVSEQELELSARLGKDGLFPGLAKDVASAFGRFTTPVRFVVPESAGDRWHCEVGMLLRDRSEAVRSVDSIFRFERRRTGSLKKFNAVLLVPTGIGAEIGGHAGDAGPVARLLGSACDTLITHPNVVNASDINEMPENAWYVEGSVITRLLMGTIGLQPGCGNRVLVVIDAHPDEFFVNVAVNAVNAARATYGLRCPAVVQLEPPVKLRARYTSSGRARSFERRRTGSLKKFNAVLLVPTGIGAEIGGHAGDAGPVARLLGSACDTLITHPNVVNASDINEMPENAWYVEGSVITRLLMGTIGLQPGCGNRVLVVIDAHPDEFFVNVAVNAVNAARATYGLRCPAVVQLEPPVKLRARYTSSGRAAGRVEGMSELCGVLDEHRANIDAVSLASVVDVPRSFHMDYFRSEGTMVNPWGGVEAMLTHALSCLYDIPTAHSPMLESQEIANMDAGIVDPRMAAEAVSVSFLQCTLKGLMRSPKIVADPAAMQHHSVLTATDVACLVIPDGCIGLPTLAALEQGISVIAVRENRNVMQNDLAALPWRDGQLWIVENYWEAVGVMTAMRAGIAPESVRRPLARVTVTKKTARAVGITPSRRADTELARSETEPERP